MQIQFISIKYKKKQKLKINYNNFFETLYETQKKQKQKQIYLRNLN
jgi:hypothetical protein